MHWLQMDSLQRLLQNLRSWFRWLLAPDILAQDTRYAFRTFRRNPGFALVAVLILALGIGANVAVFSVVNTILLRPLPFHDPQQLAWFAGNNGSGGLSDTTYQIPAYEAYQRSNRSFQELTAFVPYYSLSETKLIGRGEPKPVSFVWVAGNFFQTLGIQPALGRLFTTDESVKGGRPAVLLSYPLLATPVWREPADCRSIHSPRPGPCDGSRRASRHIRFRRCVRSRLEDGLFPALLHGRLSHLGAHGISGGPPQAGSDRGPGAGRVQRPVSAAQRG